MFKSQPNTKIMIKKILLASIAFSGLALAADAQYSKASAANISFTPTYANIDGDPIFDKIVAPGDILSFDINYDTNNIVTNPPQPSSVLIQFSIDLDVSELDLVALPTATPGSPGTITATATGFTGLFNPIPQSFTGTFTSFQVRAKQQLPNDGNPDVTLSLLRAVIATQDVAASFTVGGGQNAGRIMEVQKQEGCGAAVPRSSFIASVGNIIKSAFIAPAYAQTFPVCTVPEPSLNLGVFVIGTFGLLGAASTLNRKLKSSNPSEKETTKVS